MIYSFINNDSKEALGAIDRLVSGLLKKRPEASVYSYDTENFSTEKFEELSVGAGLFFAKDIIICRNLSEDKEIKELVSGLLVDCKKSDSIFVFWETGDDKTFIKNLEKHSEVTKKKESKSSAETFNPFALADALTTRDRQKLWVLYQKGLRSGQKPDDFLRTLVWQAKTMILVSTAKTGEADHIKPYPRQKAVAGAKKYSDQELKNLFLNLTEVAGQNYPQSYELEIALEKAILEL